MHVNAPNPDVMAAITEAGEVGDDATYLAC